MKRILFLMLAVVIVATALLLTFRSQYPQVPAQPQPDPMPQTALIEVTYMGEDDQTAQVSYDNANGRAYLTFGPYSNAEVVATTSASGARFANEDLGLIVWEKGDELSIYKDDEPIFRSVSQRTELSREQALSYLTDGAWQWHETLLPDGTLVVPKNAESFTLRFAAEGGVTGTTDCNNFSGTYSVSEWDLSFGSLMSTLMFCEDSQETEFTSAVAETASFAFTKGGDLTLDAGQKGIVIFAQRP